jgi:hypothetical protein
VYLAEFGGTLLIGALLAMPAVTLVSPVLTLVERGLMRFGLDCGASGPASNILLTAFGYTAGCIAGEGFLSSRNDHQGNIYWTAGAATFAAGLATWGAVELGLGQNALEKTELAGCIAPALSVPATAVLVNHLTWRPGAYPLPYGARLTGPSLAVRCEVRSETARIRGLDFRLMTLRV